jgi:hypothetical protein
MTDDTPDWPREIWMAEREAHHQGVVTATVFDPDAAFDVPDTIDPAWAFHRYVDGDIHDSMERYYQHQLEAERADRTRLARALAEAASTITDLYRRLAANEAEAQAHRP